ncbi:MalY/PatB family protein [Gracilibacillus sp. Marseille-QA3620]
MVNSNIQFIERKGTGSLKWDHADALFNGEGLLPMWVADMDLGVPRQVQEALIERVNHPIFGYARPQDSFYESVINWLKNKHHWTIQKEQIFFSSGVVPSIAASILAFTEPGDKVMIQSPVYAPFYSCINENSRTLVENPLRIQDNRLEIDFEDFENKLKEGVKLFILCSPHNPGGMVWSKKELARMAELCADYDVLIISDEIHADLSLSGYEHTPIATINPNTITLMAPSKTFNIAGLQASLVITEKPEIMKKLTGQFLKQGFYGLNVLAYPAMEAAYTYGADWLKETTSVIEGNVELVTTFINDKLPNVNVIKPEASFLIWIDLNGLGLTDAEITKRLIQKGRLALEPGTKFGKAGSGFVRMNIGSSPETVKEGLNRLYTAFSDLV